MAASGGRIAQRRLNKREYACQTEKILAEKSIRRLLCISMGHGHIEQYFRPEGRVNPRRAGLQWFLCVRVNDIGSFSPGSTPLFLLDLEKRDP